MRISERLNQVIIVSDDKIQNVIPENHLEKLSKTNCLTVFTSAGHALKYLSKACIISENRLCPDLVFLEKSMCTVDGLDGIDFIEELISNGISVSKAIKFVIVSDQFTEKEKDVFLSYGVVDFLHKPLVNSEVDEIIERYL